MVDFDHYKEAEGLAEALRKEKLEEYADRIINAIEGGSTGTEIFMALRWNITSLLNDKSISISKSIKDKANRLYEELDKALQ